MAVPFKIRQFLDTKYLPHYLVIGHCTKKVIGCTRGKQGKLDVLAEEPGSTFKRCSRRKCPICNEEEIIGY